MNSPPAAVARARMSLLTKDLIVRPHASPRVSSRVRARFTVPALATVSVVALGLALQVNYGQYDPTALNWLTLAILACAAAVLMSRRETPSRVAGSAARHESAAERQAMPVIAAALAIQFAMLLSRHPGVAELGPAVSLWPFRLGVAGAAVATAGALFSSGTLRRLAAVGMLAAHFSLGLWVLLALPRPGVDVAIFQHDACRALLAGTNPYAITFPDIAPAGTDLYGRGMSVGGRLEFGYPYPPLTLLLALPGYLLGDFRFAQLAAMTGAGALILFGGARSRLAAAAAALLLFTPRGFFVLQAGWTEPFVVLALAAVVCAAGRLASSHRWAGRSLAPSPGTPGEGWGEGSRAASKEAGEPENTQGPHPNPLPEYRERGQEQCREREPIASRSNLLLLCVALGLFLATKQYTVLALPALPLLIPATSGRARVRYLCIALATALLITAPFALWSPRAFIHSVALLQFHQPFRPDALSYFVPLARILGTAPPAAISFVFAALAAFIAWRRLPRTPGGFALAVAFIFLVFFAFNKQAFCNYYHFVVGALCCAIGAWNDQAGDAADAAAPAAVAATPASASDGTGRAE